VWWMLPAFAAPDLLLLHGDVWTMDPARPRAAAIAVEDGAIVALGDDLRALAGPETRVVDLGGRVVLPGFVDAHLHPVEGGLELAGCPLFDAPDREALLTTLAGCEGRGWLEGTGWALPIFPPAGPTRQELDAVTGDRPALLWAADGHSAWVNTAALRRAGVDADTPDPPGGRIERAADGSPSGTLREAAMDLVAAHLPAPSAAALDAGLARAVALANRHGITSVLEACADPAGLGAWLRAERRGLTLRATVALCTDEARGPEQVAALRRQRARATGPLVRVDTAKIFADGVLEARTAAMLQPYTDAPPAELAVPEERLVALVRALAGAGFGVHVHAIGDRAVRATLDAMAAARADGAQTPFSVAHLEVVDPADRPRFRALDVAAVFQPLWAWPDEYVRDLTWPGLDPALHQALYPIGSVLRAGAVVGFGSDWSVSSLVPLEGVEVAVTRRGPDGGEALGPEEAIGLDEALRAYTAGAARAIGRQDEAGVLAVGRPADLVVLTAEPRVGRVSDVAATLFGGRVVWSDGTVVGLGGR
jgi:predicted amidohydrolase YtcJ